jgi:hypothetical protein
MPTSKVTLTKRVADLERQLDELRSMIAAGAAKTAVEAAPVKVKAAAASARATVPVLKPASAPLPQLVKKTEVKEEISHEVLAVIAAAVAHFLGKSARIRSARLVHPVGNSPWAQQGRVFVQASHNLAMTR